MSELRKEPVLGQWVIVKVADSLGPESYTVCDQTMKHKATCQFCPGRESMTPHEVGVIKKLNIEPGKSDWQVRTVPNKFPALKIEGDWEENIDGMLMSSNGIGAHEVVIETPDHEKSLADLSEAEFENVIEMYRERLADLSKDKRFKYVVIFKNFGESAGTSVEHAHSQIIALPMIPKYVQLEMQGAQEYFDTNKSCIFCDILNQEQKQERRLITQNDDFVSFCPFAPRFPFECWIVPKKHQSEFSKISDEEEKSLARVFRETLLRIKNCLSNPSYNFFLHIAPINDEFQKSFHWHIEIVPKLTAASGFERGTGLYVVPTDPDKAAEYLRKTVI